MLHKIFQPHMLWTSVVLVWASSMNIFKRGVNSISWKEQLEKKIKGTGKVQNLRKGTMTTRAERRDLRTQNNEKKSSAACFFAVSCALKYEQLRCFSTAEISASHVKLILQRHCFCRPFHALLPKQDHPFPVRSRQQSYSNIEPLV